jgi:hypothetical protein
LDSRRAAEAKRWLLRVNWELLPVARVRVFMNLSFWELIKRLLRSHLAHVLLAVSWCFILFVMVEPSMYYPWFARCIPTPDDIRLQNHYGYPIWVIAIDVAHLPSVLLTRVVSNFFQRVFGLSCALTAKLELAVFFIFSTIQWLLFAYGIDSLGRWMKSRKQRSQQGLAADSPVSGL